MHAVFVIKCVFISLFSNNRCRPSSFYATTKQRNKRKKEIILSYLYECVILTIFPLVISHLLLLFSSFFFLIFIRFALIVLNSILYWKYNDNDAMNNIDRKLLQASIRANKTGHFIWVGSDSWGAKSHPVRDQEFAAVNTITVLPQRTNLEGKFSTFTLLLSLLFLLFFFDFVNYCFFLS